MVKPCCSPPDKQAIKAIQGFIVRLYFGLVDMTINYSTMALAAAAGWNAGQATLGVDSLEAFTAAKTYGIESLVILGVEDLAQTGKATIYTPEDYVLSDQELEDLRSDYLRLVGQYFGLQMARNISVAGAAFAANSYLNSPEPIGAIMVILLSAFTLGFGYLAERDRWSLLEFKQ